MAAAECHSIQRIVITSSFASILDIDRKGPPYFTYTCDDWNPLTYDEAVDPSTSAVVAYRGSKKFAELEAWNFIKNKNPTFDIITLCPPMTFGPVVHPVGDVENLNESNKMLWNIAKGEKLPEARVPFWVDVRDLAEAHVKALLNSETGNRRFVVASKERFSYALAAKIIGDAFPWAQGTVSDEEQQIDESYGLDGETTSVDLGINYRKFRDTVVDLVSQAMELKADEKA
jgi:nucleoside-diphosphate-sugar epimerase